MDPPRAAWPTAIDIAEELARTAHALREESRRLLERDRTLRAEAEELLLTAQKKREGQLRGLG